MRLPSPKEVERLQFTYIGIKFWKSLAYHVSYFSRTEILGRSSHKSLAAVVLQGAMCCKIGNEPVMYIIPTRRKAGVS